jgi:uncharacterized protein
MMEILVQRGVSVAAVDSKGNTVIMIAVEKGHKPAVKWLLQQDIAVNAVRHDGYTALHCVSANSSSDDVAMIELLLANGADVHKRTEHDQTALELAAESGDVQCARALIAAGADVNHSSSLNMTSLHIAIKERRAAVVQLLLEHGATAVINSVTPIKCFNGCCDGATALMMCTESDTVKVLLAAGADIHITNHVGDTCLHVAAKHNWIAPMLCLLIKAGADLHAVSKTAAQLAHERGYTLIEQLLNRAAQQGH